METEYEIETVYTYFPLHPDTPPEGRTLEELFRGREAQLHQSKERLVALMRAEGLEYGDRTHTYNSRLAQELAAWGDEVGATAALHDGLYRAYFVDNLNLMDVDVLVRVASSAGLDPDEARVVLEERRMSATIDAHWKRALEAGVSGVPTFAAGGYGVVGAQPYETLIALMQRVGIPAATSK